MYPGLNAIRAFAFLAVFLIHVERLGGGYLGVIAFFVLSGFLITPILVGMRASLPARDYFARFYGRRALRIFPLYYMYLGAASALAALALYQWGEFPGFEGASEFIAQLPWAALFMIDFTHAGAGYQDTPLVSHFWSLAVEEQFYLLWPLAIFLTPPKHLRSMLLGLAAAGPFIRLYIGSDLALAAFPGLDSNYVARVYFLPFSHIDAFAIGGYVALYGKSHSAVSVLLLAAATFGLGALSTWVDIRMFYPTGFGYGTHMRNAYQHVWGYTLVNVFFAWLVVHVRDRKFFPTLFENRALDYLGRISYGLYVYHFAAIYVVSNGLPHFPEIIRIALSLGLTLLVSAASYEFVEKRFTALKDVYFDKGLARDQPKAEPHTTLLRDRG